MAQTSQAIHCQWYQTDTTVTASFKLRPSETRGKITAQFWEKYCAAYDGGRERGGGGVDETEGWKGRGMMDGGKGDQREGWM